MNDNSVSVAAVCVVLLMFFFLVGREIVCWYWKINKTVELQNAMLKELKAMNEELQKQRLGKVS
ncbi:MAG: hypothetical protein ACKOX6_18375 [Bdellovibrio sp.]